MSGQICFSIQRHGFIVLSDPKLKNRRGLSTKNRRGLSITNRRGLLTRIVQGFAITGSGFLAYPFIKALIPSFSSDLSLDVEIGDLSPGQSKIVHWLGRNLFVHRRDQTEIKLLQNNLAELKDVDSKESKQPNFAQNDFRSMRPEIFVVFNNCTHLGCEVLKESALFKCPCHQSDFDGAGRVHEDAAAPTNLEVPNYQFVTANRIRLLENEV